jgi:hypothetical protein
VHAFIGNRMVCSIDVGLSRAYGGDIELLEILDDHELTVIRPNHPVE